jgi:hypothetical protein
MKDVGCGMNLKHFFAIIALTLSRRRKNSDKWLYFISHPTSLIPSESSAANLIAACILEDSARFLPAISKAVPWSTDVLMSGKPSVTLTDAPNDKHFTAIVA